MDLGLTVFVLAALLDLAFAAVVFVGELEVSLAMLSPYLMDSAYSSLTSATVSRAFSILVNNGKISYSRTKPGRKIAKIGHF